MPSNDLHCWPCADDGVDALATNLEAVLAYDCTPMCDEHTQAAGEAYDEAQAAAFHGGSSWGDSAQMERARALGAVKR